MSGCINCYEFELPGGKKEIVKTDGPLDGIKFYETGLCGLDKGEKIIGIGTQEIHNKKIHVIHIFENYAGALIRKMTIPIGDANAIEHVNGGQKITTYQFLITPNASGVVVKRRQDEEEIIKSKHQIVVKKL